jgi:hypothetical protein
MKPQDEERVREAQEALRRVEAETESVGSSAMARAARHMAGADAPQDDRIEVWGRRIGRGLGLLFALYLAATLFQHFAG